jgi:hypothetical protein
VSVKKLNRNQMENFRINFSFFKSIIFYPIISLLLFLSFLFFLEFEIEILTWSAVILFIILISSLSASDGWLIVTKESVFSLKNKGLVVWSYKDQLNLMDKVYSHDDIEEFTIKDGFLKKKVSVLFKDGSKEELSSYFVIFKYE